MFNGILNKVSSCFLPSKKRDKSAQYNARRTQEIEALLAKIDFQTLNNITLHSDQGKDLSSTKSTNSNAPQLKKTSSDFETTTQQNHPSFAEKLKIDPIKMDTEDLGTDQMGEIQLSSGEEDSEVKLPNKNIAQISCQTKSKFTRKNNFARKKVTGAYNFQEEGEEGLKEELANKTDSFAREKPAPVIKIDAAEDNNSSRKQGPGLSKLKEVEETLKAKNHCHERKNNRKSTTNQTPSEKIEEIRKIQEAKIYDKEKYKKEMEKAIARLKGLSLPERLIEEEKFIKELIDDPGTHQEHYLLDFDWALDYTAYLKQTNKANTLIVAVNNQSLFDPVLQTIKKTLQEGVHYMSINEKTWLFLMNMYGGGPEVSKSYFIEEQSMNSVHSRSSSLFSESQLRSLETQKSDAISTGDSVLTSPIIKTSSIGLQNKIELLDKQGSLSIKPPTPKHNESAFGNRGVSAEKSRRTSIMKPAIYNYGLQNTSNYCFLNACLQCLLCFDEFNEFFESEKFKQIKYKTIKEPHRFTLAYFELLKSLRKHSKTNYTNASHFKKNVKKQFDPYEQHDIQEFLRFILSEIQDELNPYFSKKRSLANATPEQACELYLKLHISIVDKLFSGLFLNQVTCKKCNSVSKTFDPFLDLSVPINGKTIYDSLNSFFAEESLPDLYKCEFCRKKSQAKKNLSIVKSPKILVIHLKRFKTYPTKRKLGDFVDFPIDGLDIKAYCSDKNSSETVYNLRAFGTHLGSLDGGHYVAFGKRKNDWFYFDDEEVTKISKKEIEKKDAYLLFYERVSL